MKYRLFIRMVTLFCLTLSTGTMAEMHQFTYAWPYEDSSTMKPRGGTSKGVFFRLQDLPESCQVPGQARDKLFMRVIGSPDTYSAHIDGMGGATSSTSTSADAHCIRCYTCASAIG